MTAGNQQTNNSADRHGGGHPLPSSSARVGLSTEGEAMLWIKRKSQGEGPCDRCGGTIKRGGQFLYSWRPTIMFICPACAAPRDIIHDPKTGLDVVHAWSG